MKKIIPILLISIFILTTSITVFATTSIVDSQDEQGFFWGTNGKSICKSKEYYYCYFYNDTWYEILVSDIPLTIDSNGLFNNNGGTFDRYIYNSDTNEYEFGKSYINTSESLGTLRYLTKSFYSNYDIKYTDDSDFFSPAPLTDSKPMIAKGITIQQIVMKSLIGIKYLIPLVVGFLVLVIGFRKGWKMLRTVLLGA